MKQHLLTALIIATTCGTAHAIDISGCEKWGEPGPRGDWVVKCAATEELRTIQSGNAKCMFLSAGMDSFDSMLADTDNVYVNVVPGEFGPDTIGYRVMQNTKFDFANPQPYATCTE